MFDGVIGFGSGSKEQIYYGGIKEGKRKGEEEKEG